MAPNLRSQATTGEIYSAVLHDTEGQEGRPPEPVLWGCSTSLAIGAQVDHSVLLVGFGKTKSVEGRQGKAASFGSYARPRHSMAYWILKNSWGPQWGEEVSVIYWGRTGQDRPLPAVWR